MTAAKSETYVGSTAQVEDMTHSSVGASSCERWWNCPGSVALIAKCSKSPSSVFAEEGTTAHAIAEVILKEKLSVKQIRSRFPIGSKTATGIEITEEMLDAVEFYVFHVIAQYHQVVEEELGMKSGKIDYGFLSVEKRFKLKSIDEEARGTNDAIIAIPFGSLVVFDLKYGAGIQVQATNNRQLLYYAAGAIENFSDYSSVRLEIVQPRIEQKVKTWTISMAELEEFREELKAKIAATRKPDAILCSGSHCKFCPAMSICPEQKKNVLSLTGKVFSEIIEPIGIEEWDNVRLGDALPKLDILEEFISSVRYLAKSRAEAGSSIPGYSLVSTMGNRKWRDEVFVVKKFLGKYKKDELFTSKLKSPAQLEKIVGKGEVEELTIREQTGTKLVRGANTQLTEAASVFSLL